MAQWRDEENADAGTIEELAPVAQPARVGGNRSARIPALLVGAILVGVVAVGVSGRSVEPRTSVAPLTAASATPAPFSSADPTPVGAGQGDEPSPSRTLAPRPPAPFPVELSPESSPFGDELHFWLVLRADGEPLLRADLIAANGFRQRVPIGSVEDRDLRVRLVGRLGSNRALRLADVAVPRVPEGSLDLPLVLAVGLVEAGALGLGAPLADLRYELRLESGPSRAGSLLVAEVAQAYTTTTTYNDAPNQAARDRALASGEVREALTHSSRCARMLDPRIGRSEANLDGCLPSLAREGVTWTVTPGTAASGGPTAQVPQASPPSVPDGATYWLDLRLDGQRITLQPLDEVPDGTYEAFFPYPESWYVKAPELGLYGPSIIDGRPAPMAIVQLSKGPRGQPGIPVELASGPVRRGLPGSTFWSVTLTRGQPHGLAILVQVRPRITR